MVEDISLTGAEAGAWFDFIISRAAADAALAIRLSDILNAAGFATLIGGVRAIASGDAGSTPEGRAMEGGDVPHRATAGARIGRALADSQACCGLKRMRRN